MSNDEKPSRTYLNMGSPTTWLTWTFGDQFHKVPREEHDSETKGTDETKPVATGDWEMLIFM